jgi:hypothetical protein
MGLTLFNDKGCLSILNKTHLLLCMNPMFSVKVPLVLCGSPMTCVGVPYDPHGSSFGTLWASHNLYGSPLRPLLESLCCCEESLITLVGVPLLICGSPMSYVGVP